MIEPICNSKNTLKKNGLPNSEYNKPKSEKFKLKSLKPQTSSHPRTSKNSVEKAIFLLFPECFWSYFVFSISNSQELNFWLLLCRTHSELQTWQRKTLLWTRLQSWSTETFVTNTNSNTNIQFLFNTTRHQLIQSMCLFGFEWSSEQQQWFPWCHVIIIIKHLIIKSNQFKNFSLPFRIVCSLVKVKCVCLCVFLSFLLHHKWILNKQGMVSLTHRKRMFETISFKMVWQAQIIIGTLMRILVWPDIDLFMK
jgi:hypothetical protein